MSRGTIGDLEREAGITDRVDFWLKHSRDPCGAWRSGHEMLEEGIAELKRRIRERQAARPDRN